LAYQTKQTIKPKGGGKAMTLSEILSQYALPILLSGTFGAVVMAIINRKKTKAETNKIGAESNSVTIKNSIELENIAMERYREEVERYATAMEKLDALAKALNENVAALNEVREELRKTRKNLEEERQYNHILISVLEEHQLELPQRPD